MKKENPRISPRKSSVAFGHLRQSSDTFGSLRNFFGSKRESAVVVGNLLKLVHLAVVLSRRSRSNWNLEVLVFYQEGKTGVPGEKPLVARERTNNKLNPHM